jgi:uncharacterized protein DUF6627
MRAPFLSINHTEAFMKAFFYRLISQLLILSMMTLPFATQAAMIGTDQVIANAQVQADRDRVNSVISRADVQKQLQAFGLGVDAAKDRVNALTDEEVQRLAGKLDSLPAGADSGWAWAAVIIIVAVVIWYVWKK